MDMKPVILDNGITGFLCLLKKVSPFLEKESYNVKK